MLSSSWNPSFSSKLQQIYSNKMYLAMKDEKIRGNVYSLYIGGEEGIVGTFPLIGAYSVLTQS